MVWRIARAAGLVAAALTEVVLRVSNRSEWRGQLIVVLELATNWRSNSGPKPPEQSPARRRKAAVVGQPTASQALPCQPCVAMWKVARPNKPVRVRGTAALQLAGLRPRLHFVQMPWLARV